MVHRLSLLHAHPLFYLYYLVLFPFCPFHFYLARHLVPFHGGALYPPSLDGALYLLVLCPFHSFVVDRGRLATPSASLPSFLCPTFQEIAANDRDKKGERVGLNLYSHQWKYNLTNFCVDRTRSWHTIHSYLDCNTRGKRTAPGHSSLDSSHFCQHAKQQTCPHLK